MRALNLLPEPQYPTDFPVGHSLNTSTLGTKLQGQPFKPQKRVPARSLSSRRTGFLRLQPLLASFASTTVAWDRRSLAPMITYLLDTQPAGLHAKRKEGGYQC